jgi:hypothetical protein
MSKLNHSVRVRRLRAAGAAIALAVSAMLSQSASATPPASVVGSWSILVDQTYTTLDITNQGGPGGPGGSTCRLIIGTIGIAPITGHYCLPTGRIHFLHKNVSSGATVRDFTGSVTAATAAAPAHMAGTFNVVNVAFGPFGEYPFSASK